MGGVHLWTLEGLPATARLYAVAGFAEVERVTASQWGKATVELRLEWVVNGDART